MSVQDIIKMIKKVMFVLMYNIVVKTKYINIEAI